MALLLTLPSSDLKLPIVTIVTLKPSHKANEEALAVYYIVINVENTRLRLVFSTFPSCSQIGSLSKDDGNGNDNARKR